ncbi:MAG: WbqC family protein, partial [Campylobacterota bacterium]|nr:WbqC family protein [Campylobacterota bacterium]
MKKIAILQSNYIPWKGYFDLINMIDEFILYDDMQYTKRDWRNRNKIQTPQGLKWLSIPVEVKGKYFQKISDTKVSDKDWGKKHWTTIKQNYSKAPYFKEYKDIFEELYLNSDEEYLSQINYKFIVAICKILGITTKIRWSSEFELIDGQTEKLLGICKDCNADVYLSGAAAKDYFDME